MGSGDSYRGEMEEEEARGGGQGGGGGGSDGAQRRRDKPLNLGLLTWFLVFLLQVSSCSSEGNESVFCSGGNNHHVIFGASARSD